MKFKSKKDLLVEGFNKVLKAVKTKTNVPILQGILIEVEQDLIRLTGSDSNETIQHCIPVDGENIEVVETGKTVLPKQIVDITKKLNKEVIFSSSSNGLMTKITSGKSEFEINCMDAEEYPKFPQVDLEKPTIILKGDQFQNIIRKTAFAASTSEVRPILQGICFEMQGDCLNLVCTDSHRLSQVSLPTTLVHQVNTRLVIPAKVLDNAVKVSDLQNDVEIFVLEKNILIKNGPTFYMARLLEGNYPDTSRLIPQDFIATITINRKELLNALELISGISSQADNNNKGVAKLQIGEVVTVSSYQAQTGSGKVEIPFESLEGDVEFTLSFSIKYAIDALKEIDSDFVNFHFTGSMRPFLFTPSEENELKELHLILPIRTI
jgi:DNA polymerase III subunit beta